MEHTSVVVVSKPTHSDSSSEGCQMICLDNVCKEFDGARKVTALDGTRVSLPAVPRTKTREAT